MRFKVQLIAGSGFHRIRKDFAFDMSEREAYEFCSENHWEWLDENGFCWDMDYVEDRS